MDVGEDGQERGKVRRRVAAKPPAREEAGNRKKSLCLSPEACERLGIHAVKQRKSESSVIDELIRTHLRRYVVSDRGGIPAEETSASQADEIKDSGATLPIGETLTPPEHAPQAEGPGQGRGGRRRTA